MNLTITPSSSSPTEVVSSCNSYTWNANGTNYTASGTYTSVSNCVTRTLNLTINIATTPTGSSTQTINGTTTTTVSQLVATPSSGATLVWYASSADASTGANPLSGSTVLVDGATYYGVSENGICRSAPLAVTVTVVLGAESFDVSKFSFYPNPVLDVLNLNYSQELSGIKIFNMIGQELINKSFNADKIQVDMSGLPEGNYFIEVRSLETTKMIKVIKK